MYEPAQCKMVVRKLVRRDLTPALASIFERPHPNQALNRGPSMAILTTNALLLVRTIYQYTYTVVIGMHVYFIAWAHSTTSTVLLFAVPSCCARLASVVPCSPCMYLVLRTLLQSQFRNPADRVADAAIVAYLRTLG